MSSLPPKRHPILLFLLIVITLSNRSRIYSAHAINTSFFSFPDFDPYKVLSITNRHRATADQIQKAYRQKALETHPDKNPNNPRANDEFRRVSEAYDILGNPSKKQRYDAQLRRQDELQRQAKERERKQAATRRAQKEQEKKDRLKRQREMVKNAKALDHLVMKLSTIDQFEKAMLVSDNHGAHYKQHSMLMFVSNKNAEKMGEEEYYFPYPFAGEEGDYAGLIQVAKVRFNAQTELTKLFGAKSHSNSPHIIFAKKGDPIHKFHVFQPSRHSVNQHAELASWVRPLSLIQAKVLNRHALPIDVFVMREKQVIFYHEALKPHFQIPIPNVIRPGDRMLAFDSRVDNYPGGVRIHEKIRSAAGVFLMDAIASHDGIYTVEHKKCYDLSSQCQDWFKNAGTGRKNNQCMANPEFMHHICPLSCGVCSEHVFSDVSYMVFHSPIHKFPKVLRGSVHGGRFFMEDVHSIVKLRKNAAAAFYVVGMLVTFNIALLKTLRRVKRPSIMSNSQSSSVGETMLNTYLAVVLDILLVSVAAALGIAMKWIVSTSARKVPFWLKSFHGDFARVAKDSDICMVLFTIGVVASVYLKAFLGTTMNRKMNATKIGVFIAALLALVAAILGVLSYMMSSNISRVVRWKHVWEFRKNAATVIVTAGLFGGAGLMSLKRLLGRTHKTAMLPLIFSNSMVLGAVWGLASLDKNFAKDLHHVFKMRKNAAFAFVLLGILTGKLAVRVFEKCSVKNPKKVKTL